MRASASLLSLHCDLSLPRVSDGHLQANARGGLSVETTSQLCLAPLGALSISDSSVPDCLSTLPSYCLVLGVLWVCSQSCVNFGAAEIQGPSVSFDRGVREILCLSCFLASLWRSRSWPACIRRHGAIVRWTNSPTFASRPPDCLEENRKTRRTCRSTGLVSTSESACSCSC